MARLNISVASLTWFVTVARLLAYPASSFAAVLSALIARQAAAVHACSCTPSGGGSTFHQAVLRLTLTSMVCLQRLEHPPRLTAFQA